MLFTEENIKNLRVTKCGNFKQITTGRYYYYYYACENCGYPHLHMDKTKGRFCSYKCIVPNDVTIETKQKMSRARKGKKYPEHSKRMKGKNNPAKRPDVRSKISGINHPNYIDGRSMCRDKYCTQWSDKEYKNWLKYERDGGKCQNPQCNGKHTKLHLHHINYDKKDCRPINLITVCISCNSKANYNREWHKVWYTEIMNRLGYNPAC